MNNDARREMPPPNQVDPEACPIDDEPESQREIRPWKGTSPRDQRFTQPFPAPWR